MALVGPAREAVAGPWAAGHCYRGPAYTVEVPPYTLDLLAAICSTRDQRDSGR
ncbi:MAG TPA: hypothetical protein VFA78_01660 [Chloroflexota bacterium]|nr:hypothetical protein [Chloroflexota bacterium]